MGKRSKFYNKTTLTAAETSFKNNFRVYLNATEKEIKNTKVSLLVSSLAVLRKSMDPVPSALTVHYGLNGDSFFPVFEFRYRSAKGAFAEPMKQYYIAINGELKECDSTTPDPIELIKNYEENIRIRRSNVNPTWSKVLPIDSAYPDPVSEWFRFDYELDRLIESNTEEGVKSLVLTCISEAICYSAAHALVNPPGRGSENRHLIAWFVNVAGKDCVEEISLETLRPDSTSYSNLAVDLGHLCPPRCK